MSQTKSIIYQQNGPELLLLIEVKGVFRDDRDVFQRVCSAVWGFSSSQRVRTSRDKWVDWDLCNFITLYLTRQQLGHRYIPKRHSIRPLEPRLDFQSSQEKIQHFHWMNFLFTEVIAYWGRSVWISAKCSWTLSHLKRNSILILFSVERLNSKTSCQQSLAEEGPAFFYMPFQAAQMFPIGSS